MVINIFSLDNKGDAMSEVSDFNKNMAWTTVVRSPIISKELIRWIDSDGNESLPGKCCAKVVMPNERVYLPTKMYF